jgi:hypothetical protein
LSAYYRNSLAEFVKASPTEIAFALVDQNGKFGFPELKTDAVDAWKDEIFQLQNQLGNLVDELAEARQWGLLLEFPIPRRQKRIDVVLLAGRLIIVLEFKSGLGSALSSAKRQVEDYALDLAYFHEPSHGRVIVPIVIGPGIPYQTSHYDEGNIRPVGTAPPIKLPPYYFRSSKPRVHQEATQSHWKAGTMEPTSPYQLSSRRRYPFTRECRYAK